ncbi:Hypothetical protein NTJ_11025 [Nesidiocoris tenuis]|uniref:Secreted protein n=1 Tax=Nesidiocoris tenuis TaxID=355587 RepID=A0ABN7B1B1_9HEMI|nr:Hypothetical protein NTJ_11025 [Nesidiocoris tenuis]
MLKKCNKTQHWRTTTRALVSFYLMHLSLSSALILECKMEEDRKPYARNKTMGTIALFNMIPFNAYVKSPCESGAVIELDPLQARMVHCQTHNE